MAVIFTSLFTGRKPAGHGEVER